jgi:Tim10/DDP family zinc finger
MSWFGGGSKKESTESSYSSSMDQHGLGGFDSVDQSNMSSGDGDGATLEFQQFSMGLQQQLLVQTVITDLSDQAFTKCLSTIKDGSLSGKEVACVYAVTNKWLDTNEFLGGRLAKKSQAAAASQYS